MCPKNLIAGMIVALTSVPSVGAARKAVSVLDAVKDGNRDVLRALLKQRADVNHPDVEGSTALHCAVLADDLETASLLVRAGANVKAASRYGVTPLSLAATNGNASLIEMLLDAGADPNDTRAEGETVLMTASRTGNADAVKVLLSHGADLSAREGWYGQTAVMWASAQNHPAVVQTLIEHGADINGRSNVLPGTPRRDIVDNATDKNGFALQNLLTTFPKGGLTPLLFAARQGALDAARVLVMAGADVNQTDPDGIGPIVLAIRNGHYDVAAFLVEQGADLNATDKSGRGPLYVAVDMHTLDWIQNRPAPKPATTLDSLGLIKLLLDKGADPNRRLKTTPPTWKGDAVVTGNAFGNILGPGTTPFMRAAKNGDLAAMRALLNEGADPNLTPQNQTTALMATVGGLGRRYGEDLHVPPQEEDNAVQIATLLLEQGANINAANDAGLTALHGAAMLGADAVVRFLSDRGAKLDVKNKQGRTPLDEALKGVTNNDGAPGESHESTAALLRKLMSKDGIPVPRREDRQTEGKRITPRLKMKVRGALRG